MRLAPILAVLLSVGLPLAGSAEAATFDCTKAARPDERSICGNPTLSALDVLVNRAYAEVRKGAGGTPDAEDRAKALDDARLFNLRKARCGADVGCLVAAHAGALADFQVLGSTVELPASVAATDMTLGVPSESRALPEKEGTCAATRIVDIGGRLEGDRDFSTGTTVVFADGGRQVSYDKVATIAASRRGDPVLVCLTSIPKHCPPNDDRGRFYTATNLRTRGTWSLPDSQHMCGGA